jgi:hypothetical protein
MAAAGGSAMIGGGERMRLGCLSKRFTALLAEQLRQADEIVGSRGEGELSVAKEEAAIPHLAQAGDRLGRAEGPLALTMLHTFTKP